MKQIAGDSIYGCHKNLKYYNRIICIMTAIFNKQPNCIHSELLSGELRFDTRTVIIQNIFRIVYWECLWAPRLHLINAIGYVKKSSEKAHHRKLFTNEPVI